MSLIRRRFGRRRGLELSADSTLLDCYDCIGVNGSFIHREFRCRGSMSPRQPDCAGNDERGVKCDDQIIPRRLATIALPASADNRHHHGNDDYNGYGYRFVYADGNGYGRLRWYFFSSPNSAASARPTAGSMKRALRCR